LWSGVDHRRQYGACALHGEYLKLQIHTQNMQYLLLFHYNVGCTNAPECYVIRTLPVLLAYVSILKCISFMWYLPGTSKPAERISLNVVSTLYHCCKDEGAVCFYPRRKAVFLNRRAAARYRPLASIIPGRERPEETTIRYKI